MRFNLKFKTAGEKGLVVELAESIDEATNKAVLHLCAQLEKASVPGVTELVPTYRSLLVCYDPAVIRLPSLRRKILHLWRNRQNYAAPAARLYRIPTCYGEEYGPDLEYVAEHCGLTVGEVIKRHSAPHYRIYMLGFTPGFCYLGGMDPSLETPRLENPRALIPAGSVGIAGKQTGIYPVDSPGGWRLIGRTPLRLFDPGAARHFLFKAGDYLSFYPIGSDEYRSLCEQIKQGRFSLPAEKVSDEDD